jgi:8-oxo-dGTP diphosphatase
LENLSIENKGFLIESQAKRLFGMIEYMILLKTIRDSDLSLDNPAPATYEERKASRAIVFDKDNNIALLHATKKHFHKLPGGGVDEGEGLIEALKREAMEEIGCSIDNIKELAIIEEYRNRIGLHQMSYCYTADLLGEKGTPKLEPDEIADGFETVWLSLDEAIKTIESETNIDDYEGKFIQVRDLILLREAKRS